MAWAEKLAESAEKQKEKAKEKQKEKAKKLLEKYGLDDVRDDKDYETICRIAYELMGTGLQETGMALSMSTKPHEALPVYYLRTIMEQSWIIIKQLDRLNSHFDALGK